MSMDPVGVHGRFDASWAESTVAALSNQGVVFQRGLAPSDLDDIADAFGTPVPPELALFLAAGVPVSGPTVNSFWPQWHDDGPVSVAQDARSWIQRAFSFDVTHGQYWHPLFGVKPKGEKKAVEVALRYLDTCPPLIPVYSHRFLTTQPADGQRPVLSVWQAVDSIYYGGDLADYFHREFSIPSPPWSAKLDPPVPVWEGLFDLHQLGV